MAAAAAAEYTEESSGAFTPRATLIAKANMPSSAALAAAVARCHTPTISKIPRPVSAIVTTTAKIGALQRGRKKFSTAVYATKFFQFPHATFAEPAGPHNPNRSATDDKNPAAIANRAYIVSSLFAVAPRALASTLFSPANVTVPITPHSRATKISVNFHH